MFLLYHVNLCSYLFMYHAEISRITRANACVCHPVHMKMQAALLYADNPNGAKAHSSGKLKFSSSQPMLLLRDSHEKNLSLSLRKVIKYLSEK